MCWLRVGRQVGGNVQNVGFVAGFHYFGLMHMLNSKKRFDPFRIASG
jgi:hypothetical protein